jgi:hypothetical protein
LPAVSGSWASSGIGIPTCPATSTRSSVRSRAPPMPGRSHARTSKRRATTLRARSSSAACSSAGRSAKAASAACSKAMRAADTPGSAAGGPDTAGGRWSGAGSRLHPRVREATTQQAGRGRPQPLGRRRAHRPSGGTPVGRPRCFGAWLARNVPGGLPGQRLGQLPAVRSQATWTSHPTPLAQLRRSGPRPNRAAQPGPQRAPHPSSPSRMTSLRAPDAIRVDRLRASQRDHRMVGVARVRDGHGEQ